MINIECESCGCAGDVEPPEDGESYGFLACPECGELIANIDVSSQQGWVDGRVDEHGRLQASGKIGTRKQSFGQSDSDIGRDGTAAELAAAFVLCPNKINEYLCTASGPNRGRDLPTSLTGLDLPVEVKQTRYCGPRVGFLLIRPPRMTPGRMREEYIDDSIYLLLHGEPYRYRVLGWADRQTLAERGCLNPVPVRPGQRETWGIHWQKLRPMKELAGRVGKVKVQRVAV